jgi:thiol-disulfide isomerase/thioredoxin
LPDRYDSIVSLSDLRGKPTYISFFATWSNACLQELELMKSLYDEYRERIHFVSISFDRDPGLVEQFAREKGYAWTFLHNGTRYEMVHDYRLKTFPVFLLLDSNGMVYEYPAFKPSEVIRTSFDKLLGTD